MTMQTKLNKIKTALLAVSSNTYHYTAPASADLPYIVWYEESEGGSAHSDNKKIEQGVDGWVELYTLTEFDSKFDSIQTALNSIEGLAWEWSNTNAGDPLVGDDIIHHSWRWSLG